jgi:hypothetical protein
MGNGRNHRAVALLEVVMPRILALLLAVAALLAGAVSAAAQNPAPPTVVTGPATGVGQDAATVTGSVDPNGAATTWHVEYGTTTAYGLTTPERSAGADTTPVPVSEQLTGLTAATTYHFRVVATNAAGIAPGADGTLRTASPPQAPAVSTGGAQQVTPTTATLTGTVNPRGVPGSYHFEWGTTSALGQSTAVVAFGASTSNLAARAALAGLRPAMRYRFRLVATSAAGTTRGSIRSFTTARGLTGATLSANPEPTVFGSGTSLTGQLAGGAIGNVNVALQRQRFPFSERFTTVANQRTPSNGTFSFPTGPLFALTRFRVVAGAFVSPVVGVRNRVKVGIIAQRRTGGRVRFVGTTAPGATGSWTASLQRQSPSGRWVRVKRVALHALRGNRSRYRTTVGRPRRHGPFAYRVVVTPRGDGAHVRGFSRAVTVSQGG